MHKRILASAIILIFATVACLSSAPASQAGSVATIVASTLQAMTASAPLPTQQPAATQALPTSTSQPTATQAAPTQPSGVPITIANVSFVIPHGLAYGANGEQVPAVDNSNNGSPWDIAPTHMHIAFNGYNNTIAKFSLAEITVYPKQDYANVSDGASLSISRLENILSNPSAPITLDAMPRVPYFNADQVIDAQTKIISFTNGTGLRTVTQYAQGIGPISNEGLFYHFEGFTSDGNYYVIATLPIGATFLAESSDLAAPIPADGVPFPDLNGPEPDTYNNYLSAITDKLNATAPDAFQPPLSQLDELIQSITITP